MSGSFSVDHGSRWPSFVDSIALLSWCFLDLFSSFRVESLNIEFSRDAVDAQKGCQGGLIS